MRAVISFHGSGNLPFRKVSQEFLKNFETYLRGKDCSWNTVSTYMRTLRAVYNRAVDRRIAPYVPHHFRYVGLPHSLIMYENNYCLEEYLDYLKSYTIDQPLTYTTDDASYEIYYYAANSNGETEVKIPKKDSYSISGNNTDGFIITVQKGAGEISGEAATDAATQDDNADAASGDTATSNDSEAATTEAAADNEE